MSSGTPSALTTGKSLILAGLALQLLFFSLFLLIAATFHVRMSRRPTIPVLSNPAISKLYKRHLFALYTVSLLILVRSLMRLVEYAQGDDGWLISHEWVLYVFDAALMVGVMAVVAVVHPSEVNAWLRKGAGEGSGNGNGKGVKAVKNVVGVYQMV